MNARLAFTALSILATNAPADVFWWNAARTIAFDAEDLDSHDRTAGEHPVHEPGEEPI